MWVTALLHEFVSIIQHNFEHPLSLESTSRNVYSKSNNSFICVFPTTCYAKRNISNIPKGIALRLRRIQDYDEKPSVVKNKFADVGKLSRDKATDPKQQQSISQINKFITTYNPMLPNIRELVNSHLYILHADGTMEQIFPQNSITTVFKRSKISRKW